MNKPSKAANQEKPPQDSKLVALTTLLLLEENARHRMSKAELAFMMVNETHRLLPYRQCVFWRGDEKVKIESVSGLSTIDKDSPSLIWLRRIIKKLPRSEHVVQGMTSNDVDKEDHKDWGEWVSGHVAVVWLKSPDGHALGGLWMDRETAFTPGELKLLAQLADAYGHAWDRLEREHQPWRTKLLAALRVKKSRWVVAALICALMLFPVRLSVTAPMEVVARDPFVVSAPLDGAIKDVSVQPNTLVKKGDVLFTMDDTILKNQVEVSRKALDIALATYSKVSREAFNDPRSKTDLAVLKAESEAKKVDFEYAQDLLKRATVLADRDGVAVFTDANSLRGMPVQTGTRVMMITDPKDTELLIRIPAKAMILIDDQKPARIFLNVSPLNSLKASIRTVSYETTPDPDGLLTYKIRASLEGESEAPRVGLKGTARVYGGRTMFAYQMLRRPLIAFRAMLGV
ncbi:MAG: hypothetical protein DHS20C02_18960 [Micavibrio sp.]|nr:MAG: hypothetical protein DHS20C02_18960 [Micavibrio sp.]